MNITALKNFNADRADMEDLVGLLADAKALRDEYEALQIEEPEYIDTTIKSIRREITSRNADKIAARKRELTARIDSLKTPAQKKNELEKELAALEAMAVYPITFDRGAAEQCCPTFLEIPMRLGEREQIVAVVPESCSGPGWSNWIVNVYIRDADGKIREECLQQTELSEAMNLVFHTGEEMSKLLISETKKLMK